MPVCCWIVDMTRFCGKICVLTFVRIFSFFAVYSFKCVMPGWNVSLSMHGLTTICLI